MSLLTAVLSRHKPTLVSNFASAETRVDSEVGQGQTGHHGRNVAFKDDTTGAHGPDGHAGTVRCV